MNALKRMYRGETQFDFVGTAQRTLIVSAVLVVLSLLLLIVRPLNLSIDFTGGTVLIVSNEAAVSLEDVRAAMGAEGQAGARVQLTGDEGAGFIRIQTEALEAGPQDDLIIAVAAVASVSVNDVTVSAVGPSFCAEVTRRAIKALIILLIDVSVFI